jgi:hypothetical protein
MMGLYTYGVIYPPIFSLRSAVLLSAIKIIHLLNSALE